MHWVRDVALREDASRLRKGPLPRVWAAFANMAISILRLLQIEGIQRRMDQLHLSPDSAVELLLGCNTRDCAMGLALARQRCVCSPAGSCG